MSEVYVIGGPNGAGKTTSARTLFPEILRCEEFVNADVIAAGLSALHPETMALRAGRIMLERLDSLAASGRDFAFETTLSTRSFAPFLRRCRAAGYAVNILFVWLDTPEMAVERVERRVRTGGHRVPADDMRRRYERARHNLFELYMPIAERWMVCNNSGEFPRLLAQRFAGQEIEVADAEGWNRFNLG